MRSVYRRVYVDCYAVDVCIIPPRAAARIDKVMALTLEKSPRPPESRVQVRIERILKDYEDVTSSMFWITKLRVVERAREEALCYFSQLMRKRGPRGRGSSVNLPSRCR